MGDYGTGDNTLLIFLILFLLLFSMGDTGMKY